jgi:hypothetical protein
MTFYCNLSYAHRDNHPFKIFVNCPALVGKEIVFRFIIEYIVA